MFFVRMLEGLSGEPTFSVFYLDDVNRISRSMKRRCIHNPNEAMRTLHKRLIVYLRSLRLSLPFATGAVKGWSPKKNALCHQWNRYFYLTDIAHAYQSVNVIRMAEVLAELETQPVCADDFGRLISFLRRHFFAEEGLTVGGPASPDL